MKMGSFIGIDVNSRKICIIRSFWCSAISARFNFQVTDFNIIAFYNETVTFPTGVNDC